MTPRNITWTEMKRFISSGASFESMDLDEMYVISAKKEFLEAICYLYKNISEYDEPKNEFEGTYKDKSSQSDNTTSFSISYSGLTGYTVNARDKNGVAFPWLTVSDINSRVQTITIDKSNIFSISEISYEYSKGNLSANPNARIFIEDLPNRNINLENFNIEFLTKNIIFSTSKPKVIPNGGQVLITLTNLPSGLTNNWNIAFYIKTNEFVV